ncbi:MAG: hypothetical protein IKX38_03095 [Bacteroidales bacterium]|jgi:hypothetical protein|nr:hypothetical protein [Bacteroidales bacterium]MBR5719978.1 hypothetical protein [Bacteroidales bacterium]
MKKIFMLALVALMTLAMGQKAQAIENPNPKGTLVIGLRGGYYPGYGANVVADYTLVDHWWKGHFTVGAYAGYNARSYHWTYYTSRYSNIAIMPRVSYGLNITKQFEVHAGVMLGVNMQLDRWVYDSPNIDNERYTYFNFAHGEFVGARYFFTEKFGAEVELVYSGYQSYFNAGVTFKF